MTTPMPFDPIKEVRCALAHQGFYPAVKVSAELLPTTIQLSISSNNAGNAEGSENYDESDDEGSTAGSISDGEGESEEELDENY